MIPLEEKKAKQNDTETKQIMNSFDEEKESFFNSKLLIAFVVVIVLGIGTGYFFAKRSGVINVASLNNSGSSSSVPKGTIVGSSDTSTFKDKVEGVLEEGGSEGEGQFHLVRPGGDSQNVYLTSSIIDLSKYLKRKVKVWGETNKAQHVGWLMDVGRLEVLN